MKRYCRSKESRGQSIAEVCAGLFILIPIVLFILDVASLVVAQVANDDLCKKAARAAAEQDESGKGRTAAQTVVSNFKTGSLVQNVTMVGGDFEWNNEGNVIVGTEMRVKLPVPVPFVPDFTNQTMRAKATEPIVALPAD